ncbi:MAG: hypothetical protein JXE07_01915 [Candidatus Aminicenantes bacterium]|nr:hypothetical protein [Candidatus Aminicenantes bacterium]
MVRSEWRSGVRILEATLAIRSNRKSLLPVLPPPLAVSSLHTDFREVEKIPYPAGADGSIRIKDDPAVPPHFRIPGGKAVIEGPLISLARRASDLRFSLWGNLGLLYRLTLFLLEKKHGIYNLHACALYQPGAHRLFIIAGGAGSGKTVYLLTGLKRGLGLFSTETVHFRKEGRHIRWFMGSLVDNVRMGMLRRHFPEFWREGLTTPGEEEWRKKCAVDLSSYRSKEDQLVDPETVILFPRIEEGARSFFVHPFLDERETAKSLFANISEKIAETVILYDRILMPGLDQAPLSEARWMACRELAKHRTTAFCGAVFSGLRGCWGDFLKRGFR